MRQPDLIGPRGKAWKIPPTNPSQVATFIVNAPGQAPSWSWWVMAAVHLRHTPGLPAPIKQFPSAGHEVLFIALDGTPNPDDPQTFRFLEPFDLVVQYGKLSDEQVFTLVEQSVTAILNGIMPVPNGDDPETWGGTLDRTVKAMLNGEW